MSREQELRDRDLFLSRESNQHVKKRALFSWGFDDSVRSLSSCDWDKCSDPDYMDGYGSVNND